MKFIAATVIFSNIIAFGVNWIEFAVIRNADLFLSVALLLMDVS
jgi:hypothetical protein